MDYEVVTRMMIDDWQDKIQKSLEGIVFKVIKKSFPFIEDIADIKMKYSFFFDEKEVECIITFFVGSVIDIKEHEKLEREVKTMLEMLDLTKMKMADGNLWKLEIDVYIVENNLVY